MKERFFKLAKKMSSAGEHRQHRIGATLVKKNRVISVGFNRQKTHPKSPSPYKYLHAEIDCLLGIDSDILEGSEIYVYRETRNCTMGTSKPCENCEYMLRLAKVKKVHYSSEDGYKTLVL